MPLTRRQALVGSAATSAALASRICAPAIAASEPIRIGYLPALTGPSSSTGIGINRGTLLAVDEINKSGGINGRQIELIVRDTQSDPTKAVNAATELTRRHKLLPAWCCDRSARLMRRGLPRRGAPQAFTRGCCRAQQWVERAR